MTDDNKRALAIGGTVIVTGGILYLLLNHSPVPANVIQVPGAGGSNPTVPPATLQYPGKLDVPTQAIAAKNPPASDCGCGYAGKNTCDDCSGATKLEPTMGQQLSDLMQNQPDFLTAFVQQFNDVTTFAGQMSNVVSGAASEAPYQVQ